MILAEQVGWAGRCQTVYNYHAEYMIDTSYRRLQAVMLPRNTMRRSFNRARLFVACCTLIMLTATVIHRPATVDGRAMHIALMPYLNQYALEDHTWLSIRQQFKQVNFSILKSNRAIWLIKQEPDLAAEIQYRTVHSAGYQAEYGLYEEYMLYQAYEQHQQLENFEEIGKHEGRANKTDTGAFRRLSDVSDLSGNEIPLAYGLDLQISDTAQFTLAEEPIIEPVTWREATPTPPPQHYYPAS